MKLGWLDGCIAAVGGGILVSVLAATIQDLTVSGLVFVAILSALLYVLFAPVNYTRTAADFEAGRTRRKAGPIPPPFPNSWFNILHSWEIKAGETKPVDVFGTNLVVFRSESGKVGVLNAYCPHLGANLGVGGKVCGESIECPFHGWKFGTDGRCTRIPGQDSIPDVARVRSWPVIERNNMILVWFHVDEKEPEWEPPVVSEIDENQFVRHSYATYTINVHNQDIFENGGDVAHLTHLHYSLFPSIANYFHNEWDAKYQPGSKENGDAHVAHISVIQDQYITPFGNIKLRLSHVKSEIQQVGPGLVYARLHSPVGFVFVFETVTPKEALEQEVRLTFWTPPSVPRFLAKFVVWGYLAAFEQDLAIWNNKTHVAKPLFSRSDKMIPPLRRWSQQFFSENSSKAQSRLHPLEW